MGRTGNRNREILIKHPQRYRSATEDFNIGVKKTKNNGKRGIDNKYDEATCGDWLLVWNL